MLGAVAYAQYTKVQYMPKCTQTLHQTDLMYCTSAVRILQIQSVTNSDLFGSSGLL